MFNHIMAAEDGRIYSTYSSGQATIMVGSEEVDPFLHWYDWETKSVRLKEEMRIDVSPTSINNVPSQCSCAVSGPITTTVIVPKGDNPASFDLPGEYELVFTPDDPKYLPLSVTLEVFV